MSTARIHVEEGRCYGNDCEDDETMPPGQDKNAERKSTISASVDAKGLLAMGACVPRDAETSATQTVTGGGKNSRQCRCGYQCIGYGLVHGRLTI